jgi:hypothetical protein
VGLAAADFHQHPGFGHLGVDAVYQRLRDPARFVFRSGRAQDDSLICHLQTMARMRLEF